MAERKLINEFESKFIPIAPDDFSDFINNHYWISQKNHLTEKAMKREAGILNNHLGPYFAGPMSQIDRSKIVKYISKRLNEPRKKPSEKSKESEKKEDIKEPKKISTETVRKELNILKHALRIAVKIRLIQRNPFDDLDSKDWPAKGEERTRHLSGDEWSKILPEIPIQLRSAIVLLVNTGMRRGELLSLEWKDVDFINGLAWIAKTKGGIKTGKGRWVKLNASMVEIIKSTPKEKDNQKIFWFIDPDYLTQCFRKAVKKADLLNIRLHDLRHTFATVLRQEGIGIDVIAKLLGHSDLRMTQRYAHISDDTLAKATQAVEGKFDGKIN